MPHSDAEFIETWLKFEGNAAKTGKALDISERQAYRLRNVIAGRTGVLLPSGPQSTTGRPKEYVDKIDSRLTINVNDGVLLASGGNTIWPGVTSLARTPLLWR